jgi:hypothetical protein
MYASLILSQSPYGVRQTALIPTSQGTRVMYRCGFGRGLSATWIEDTPDEHSLQELTLNAPVSLLMTDAHKRDAEFYGRTPNNVLQALGKRLSDSFVPNVRSLDEVYTEVMELAENSPATLGKFAHKQQVAVTWQQGGVTAVSQGYAPPVVQPVPIVVEPVIPEPVVEVITEPVVEPVAELIAEPVEFQTVREPAVEVTARLDSAKRVSNIITVPNAEPYFERVFEDIPESKIYDVARSTQQAVLLVGDAGTGKTSSARNYAATRQLPFVTIECTQQIDNSVTQGRFVPDEDGRSVKWVYSQLATAVQQPSVVLFNELTRMSPKSASLFLRLLAERELFVEPFNEVIKVHPECLFIADANVGSAYNGTMRADGALIDRFNIKLPFTYDEKLEEKFMPYPALLAFATGIRKASELGEDDFTIPMSTRLLQNFVGHASHFNWEFAVQRLLSNFPAEGGERDAVKMRLDSDAPRIATDLGITLAV